MGSNPPEASHATSLSSSDQPTDGSVMGAGGVQSLSCATRAPIKGGAAGAASAYDKASLASRRSVKALRRSPRTHHPPRCSGSSSIIIGAWSHHAPLPDVPGVASRTDGCIIPAPPEFTRGRDVNALRATSSLDPLTCSVTTPPPAAWASVRKRAMKLAHASLRTVGDDGSGMRTAQSGLSSGASRLGHPQRRTMSNRLNRAARAAGVASFAGPLLLSDTMRGKQAAQGFSTVSIAGRSVSGRLVCSATASRKTTPAQSGRAAAMTAEVAAAA
mmetsp:Transcript_2866/g.11514  ORF Transcript_2866/g.11514 Transcript_2866/m.11514 type:complete len:273 (-) Transcript_2866:4264-5082(-)